MGSDAYWEIDRPPSEYLDGGILTRWTDAVGDPALHIVQATSGQVTSSPTAFSGAPVFAVADEQMIYIIADDGSMAATAR
jgi:hypothetical protein